MIHDNIDKFILCIFDIKFLTFNSCVVLHDSLLLRFLNDSYEK